MQKNPALRLALLPAVLILAGTLQAGNLEPPAPPGPTMKTLDEIPPTWSLVLPAAERFQLVMPSFVGGVGTNVLDKETGLVWERVVGATTVTWFTALATCYDRTSNSLVRAGWRLPAVEELASLHDATVVGPLFLPDGHPFLNVTPMRFWSATTQPGVTSTAYVVDFSADFDITSPLDITSTAGLWCVRGGRGTDGM